MPTKNDWERAWHYWTLAKAPKRERVRPNLPPPPYRWPFLPHGVRD